MRKARKYAEALLDLLEEYVEVQDAWEDHLRDVEDGEYSSRADEKAGHLHVQHEFMLPLMQRCADAGFGYIDLGLMIPAYPATTYEDREQLLEDFKEQVKESYNG